MIQGGTRIRVGKPDIIDWYDGVISALVDVGTEPEPHLCLALAWSPDYDVRVYGLIPVTAAVARSLHEKLGKSPTKLTWNDITDFLAEVERAYSGPVVIIATESVGSDVLGEMTLPAAEIPELRLHKDRVGQTYDDARLLSWLERLGVPRPLSWPEKDRLAGEAAGPTADAFLSAHLQHLDMLLKREGRPSIDRSKMKFILEDQVHHESARWPGKPGDGSPVLRATVAAQNLMSPEQFLVLLADTLKGGPSYVHANLTRTREGDEIIDIRFGAAVGNPWPSPNVSFTPHVVDVTITE